jgi:hypothetical protein
MTLYCNLDYCKAQLETARPTAAALSSDDQRLLGYIRAVSLRLDSEFPQVPRWSYFAPYIGSRTYLLTPDRVNSRLGTFQFKEPLLALTGDVTLGTQTLVDGTNVSLWPTTDQPPFHALRMLGCCGTWYSNCGTCDTPLQVTIPGIWGYHRDYANAWPVITTLAAAVITTTVTTITLTSVTVADPYGIAPALSPGSLLLIDDEYLEIITIDPATKIATVRRGVNGSTAAAHLIAANVAVWQVELPVQYAVARQAALSYARIGKYTVTEVIGMTEIKYPQDFLVEVRAMMQGYV